MGKWIKTVFKFKKLIEQLPQRPLTNIDFLKYSKSLKIPYFRGVYMRNDLPRTGPKKYEAIINLDEKNGPGTHWAAYQKIDNTVTYFDSFGNLQPPRELVKYFEVGDGGSSGSKNIIIKYNRERYQKFNTFNCGYLCLEFLLNKSN